MNITQSSSQGRSSASKAVIGGGSITTKAVAEHVRKTKAEADLRAPRDQPPSRSAVIGGGSVTTPAVAAHLRRTIPATSQR